MAIENVAVVGGSGLLGSKVVNSLLNAGFNVTAITRNESTSTFLSKMTVKRVDITSVESIKEAITGLDAVASTVATVATSNQNVIIDAAFAARVPCFIPSEFDIPSRENRHTKIGRLLAAKVQNTDYLIELAEKHDWFSWTGLSNVDEIVPVLIKLQGLGNERGFVNIKRGKFRLVDFGNEPYSISTLALIGDAVAAILKKCHYNSNDVLDIVEEITRDKFEVLRVSSAELEKTGDEKIAKEYFSALSDYLK
ncbi:hypothetical protein ACHAP5_011467 [Fusarium lateritium]